MSVSITSVALWLLYEAAFPLSPVLLVWVGGRALLPAKKQTMFQLIRDGQLFFFCTASIAILLRDIGKTPPHNAFLFGFLCFLLMVFGVLFGFVAMNKESIDEKGLGLLSLFSTLTVLGLVLGIRVSERLL